MEKRFIPLLEDSDFQAQAAAINHLGTVNGLTSLDYMFQRFQRFTVVRRRHLRVTHLMNSGRPNEPDKLQERFPDAVNSLCDALKAISNDARVLQTLITPSLDGVIALARDKDHPAHKMLYDSAVDFGFSGEEAGWFFGELEFIGYKPVSLVCADGFDDFTALIKAISVGESGLLVAGFARFTGDQKVDRRLEKIIIRLRDKGVTASIFLVLAIILTARAVAEHRC